MSSAAYALAEHQNAAVERIVALLDRYGGAILADEPGLGKSFVAAEIARREAEVELIVPASLVEQWRETLVRFGASARIFTHDAIVTDPFVAEPPRRLIVVDEAHAFRNPATQRYDALARRSVGAALLLVTATPLCNSAKDLQSLIRLVVGDDALAPIGVPSIDYAFAAGDTDAVVNELVIRRDRFVLEDHLRFGDLRRRVIRYDSGIAAIAPLIDALRFPLVGETAILRQFLLRRLESSPAALCQSLRRQRRFYDRALECLAAGRALPKREYRKAFGHEEDAEAYQGVLFWEMFVPSTDSASADEIEQEISRIDSLLAYPFSSAKRDALLKLERTDPMLIFTGWSATANDLHDAIGGSALLTGRNRRNAVEAIDRFRSGAVDVLVSTDLAAEGLNLQRAGIVVHYDIPWNPVKLDQRNGRAHRIGQKRDEVEAIYFLAHSDDTGILKTMSRKNRIRRTLLNPESVVANADLHLRPRLQPDAAILKLLGRDLPESLLRRHKEGIERLILALSREYLDERKWCDFVDLLQVDPSRPL